MKYKFNIWAKRHDSSKIFTFAYIAASVVLSVFVSLFWLIPLVFFHGFLEWAGTEDGMAFSKKIGKVLWHIKLDIALLLLSLVIMVYMEFTVGALLARIATRASAFAAWQNTIKAALLTVDDLFQMIRLAGAKKQKFTSEVKKRKMDMESVLPLVIIVLSTGLLLFSPLLLGAPAQEVLSVLKNEMMPFP